MIPEEKEFDQCGMTKEDWQALPEIFKFINRQSIEGWYGTGAIKQLNKIERKLIRISEKVR